MFLLVAMLLLSTFMECERKKTGHFGHKKAIRHFSLVFALDGVGAFQEGSFGQFGLFSVKISPRRAERLL